MVAVEESALTRTTISEEMKTINVSSSKIVEVAKGVKVDTSELRKVSDRIDSKLLDLITSPNGMDDRSLEKVKEIEQAIRGQNSIIQTFIESNASVDPEYIEVLKVIHDQLIEIQGNDKTINDNIITFHGLARFIAEDVRETREEFSKFEAMSQHAKSACWDAFALLSPPHTQALAVQ